MSVNNKDKDKITLSGAIAMGTGVMIGAGIFTLTGEIANYAGPYFIIAFTLAGCVSALTSYTYVKMSNSYPSSGGVAKILTKVYGNSSIAAWGALLMLFSMIINQSLVARTFANYLSRSSFLTISSSSIPYVATALVIFSFFINILSNQAIQKFQFIGAFFKAIGLFLLAIGGLAASGVDINAIIPQSEVDNVSILNILGSIAVGVLAFKGFTTITNSGGEITDPKKNIGKAIKYTIIICISVYLLVTFAVSNSLSINEIISAKNYTLAEAARPTYGEFGVNITIFVALISTFTGIVASMFAVSRMLTMLTKMDLVPHKHFGLPGNIQKHLLVYITVITALLTLVFNVSRIAAMGAFFYLVMDILIHYGVFKYANRKEVHFNSLLLIFSIVIDVIIFLGLFWIKIEEDPWLMIYSIAGMSLIYFIERFYLKKVNI